MLGLADYDDSDEEDRSVKADTSDVKKKIDVSSLVKRPHSDANSAPKDADFIQPSLKKQALELKSQKPRTANSSLLDLLPRPLLHSSRSADKQVQKQESVDGATSQSKDVEDEDQQQPDEEVGEVERPPSLEDAVGPVNIFASCAEAHVPPEERFFGSAQPRGLTQPRSTVVATTFGGQNTGRIPLISQEEEFDNFGADQKSITATSERMNAKVPRGRDWRFLQDANLAEVNAVTINADQLRDKDWYDKVAVASKEERKKKFGINAQNWDPSDGSSKFLAQPSATSKRKHQIGWLAHEALSNEQELLERSAHQRQHKYQAAMKYGW